MSKSELSTKTYVLTSLSIESQTVKIVHISHSFNEIIIKLHDELNKFNSDGKKEYEHFTKVHNDNRKVEVYKREPGMIYGKTKELEFIYEICEYNI